jgi:hypothetical protein
MQGGGDDLTSKLLWAFAIAALAGLVNYIQRFTGDNPPAWRWLIVMTKVLTAGFVGLLTHWLLSGWNVGEGYVNFAIAVGGYGGAETIAFFQQVFRDTVSRAARDAQDHQPKT